MQSPSRFEKEAGKSSAAFPLNAHLLNSDRPHVIPYCIELLMTFSHKLHIVTYVHFHPPRHLLGSVSLKEVFSLLLMFSLYPQMNLSPKLRGSVPFVRCLLFTHTLSPVIIFQFLWSPLGFFSELVKLLSSIYLI